MRCGPDPLVALDRPGELRTVGVGRHRRGPPGDELGALLVVEQGDTAEYDAAGAGHPVAQLDREGRTGVDAGEDRVRHAESRGGLGEHLGVVLDLEAGPWRRAGRAVPGRVERDDPGLLAQGGHDVEPDLGRERRLVQEPDPRTGLAGGDRVHLTPGGVDVRPAKVDRHRAASSSTTWPASSLAHRGVAGEGPVRVLLSRVGRQPCGEQRPGVGVLRVAEQVDGGRRLHDLAQVHDRDPVADPLHRVHVVRDEQVGQAEVVPAGRPAADRIWARTDRSSDERGLVERPGTSAGDDRPGDRRPAAAARR